MLKAIVDVNRAESKSMRLRMETDKKELPVVKAQSGGALDGLQPSVDGLHSLRRRLGRAGCRAGCVKCWKHRPIYPTRQFTGFTGDDLLRYKNGDERKNKLKTVTSCRVCGCVSE